mmetsp:Transcript_19467/g.48778  ORF Transcript_19467/g.48778 Transcript_19467/m.48778 type:complete len:237 (+) Transcript_19467:1566-2276(+)|eukprot:g16173.t1
MRLRRIIHCSTATALVNAAAPAAEAAPTSAPTALLASAARRTRVAAATSASVAKLVTANLAEQKGIAAAAKSAARAADEAATLAAEFPKVLEGINAKVTAAAAKSAGETFAAIQEAADAKIRSLQKTADGGKAAKAQRAKINAAVKPFHEALVTAQQHILFYRQRAQEFETAGRAMAHEMRKPWVTGNNFVTQDFMARHQKQLVAKAAEYEKMAADLTAKLDVYRQGAVAAAGTAR